MCACVTAELFFGSYLLSTVAHNCHIKTKCSQKITNHSQQIQIAHSKLKFKGVPFCRGSRVFFQVHSCLSAFLSRAVRYSLHLQKNMLLSMMRHFSVSKHFSVSHNERVIEGLHGLLIETFRSDYDYDYEYEIYHLYLRAHARIVTE